MRHPVFVTMAEDVGAPPAELVETMGKGMEQAFAAGGMGDAGGLYPTRQGTEIRVAAGDLTANVVAPVVAGFLRG